MGKTIGEYTAEIRDNNIRKGFRPPEGGPGSNSFGDYVALAHSELSEALEAFRDHRLQDATTARCDEYQCPRYGLVATATDCSDRPGRTGHRTRPGKPEGVGSELADVFIRLLDMADVFGIDLEHEVARKITYNATRPYQHGGRTLADALTPPINRNRPAPY